MTVAITPEQAISLPVRVAEARKIVAISDLPLRNLWITQSYFDMSNRLATIIGCPDLNWCGWASWASKSVGPTIRHGSIGHRLADVVGIRPPGVAMKSLDGILQFTGIEDRMQHVMRRVSAEASGGNVTVFNEIGLTVGVFIQIMEDTDGRASLETILAEADRMYDGLPPDLACAITHYYEAALTSDPRDRAEQVLMGNFELALREQTRLQPFIENSTQAIFGPRRSSPAQTRRPTTTRRIRKLAVSTLDRAVKAMILRLETPEGPVSLGRDVAPIDGKPLFPPELQDLRHPELIAFLKEWDRTDGSGLGSAARDWSHLPDRINLVCTLFRSRQLEGWTPIAPFTPDQVDDLLAGRFPSGRL